MSTVRGAIVLSILAQYSVKMLQFVTMLFIARLMTPAEIGVFAIAGGVVMLATTVRLLGVTQYIIREPNIDNEKVRAATGVMMLTSWPLGLAVVLGAPALADFYAEPDLRYVLWVSAIPFLLAPFASVPHAMLTRELKFGPLFRIGFVSSGVNSIAAVGLVWAGLSYMGLAWVSVLSAAAELAMILLYTPRGMPWMPSLRRAGEIVRFGVIVVGGSSLRKFSPSLPDMVLGRTGTMLSSSVRLTMAPPTSCSNRRTSSPDWQRWCHAPKPI